MGHEFEPDFEEEPVDFDVEKAKPPIEELVAQQRVVIDRELKVRLERQFFPWIVGRALRAMENGGMIVRVGHPGRSARDKRTPGVFFVPYGTAYPDVVGLIEEKRNISRDLNNILTAQAVAGTHAENLFEQAFLSLGFKIHDRDVSEWNGRRVRGVGGKQPPNLDFVIEKDKLVYGVDVKNWLQYEWATRQKVIEKVSIALQLRLIPFIIARYVDRYTMLEEIIKKDGLCYPYGTLLMPQSFESLAKEAQRVLGYPTLALDYLLKYKVEFIQKLHDLKRKKKR